MSKVIYQDNICFNFVIFLDFLSSCVVNQMYPDRPIVIHSYPAQDTLQHVIKAWCKVA